MKTYQKTVSFPKLKITPDEGSESPRKWSNLGYFITVDNRYKSPDDYPEIKAIVEETGNESKDKEDHKNLIIKRIQEELPDEGKVLAIYPVVKYDHSNISYELGENHGWDYSNNGFYIITQKSQKETGTEAKLYKKQIEAELENYTNWVNGDVWGFVLYDENGESIDSCYGFYHIEDIKDYLPEEWKDEDLTKYIKY